jgi:hypothetical protein
VVTSKRIVWDDTVVGPNRQEGYDEDALRKLAALCGWRLLKVVRANDKERRLYFEKTG